MLNVQRVLTNKRSRACGAAFEKIIDNACERYALLGKAKIEKQSEPVHYIRPYGKYGQFIANYAKKSGVDYKGTLKGGRAVVFEAKHTDGENMALSRVQPHQIAYMKAHEKLGAKCFVLISFGLEEFYRVPLEAWINMKALLGHKYISKKEAKLHYTKLNYVGQHLMFLEDL